MTGLKRKNQTNYIDDNYGNPITDPFISANVLNDHFCSVFNTVNRNDSTDNVNAATKFISENIDSKLENVPHFSIPPVSLSFVEKQLQSLNTSKSTGSDGLSARFLMMLESIIAPVLTSIYNKSLDSCIYPKIFKIAKVVAIHKRGKKYYKSNYRPISILTLISLIFERHISIHLKSYFESNDLFYSRQSGFRPKHSCQTALVKLIDDWITAIDNNEIVGTVFLDLSKAFDLVDHDILIKKFKMI
jgi:hypothetical protein